MYWCQMFKKPSEDFFVFVSICFDNTKETESTNDVLKALWEHAINLNNIALDNPTLT